MSGGATIDRTAGTHGPAVTAILCLSSPHRFRMDR